MLPRMKRLLCLVALCTAAAGVLADEPLRVGSKRFPESLILARGPGAVGVARAAGGAEVISRGWAAPP